MDSNPTLDGMLPSDEQVTRSDVAHVERAIRLRWELPADLAKALPDRLNELTNHEDPRIAIRAARALVEMNSQNSGPDENTEPQGRVCIYLPRNGRESPQVPVDDGGESQGQLTIY